MPNCCLKLCRNYKGRLKTSKEVTYHRIPNDPILRSKWIDIIRKSRGEDLWQPRETTIICSDHFRAKDLYFTKNQSRRRVKKEAIPRKAVFLTSLETDDEEDVEKNDLVEDKEKINDCVTNNLDDTSNSGFNEEGFFDVTKDNDYASSFSKEASDNRFSNTTGVTSASTSIKTGIKNGDGQKKENESDIIEDYSDLDSVYDTPEKSKIRRDLRRKIRLQKKQTLKIQSLRRQNLRLKKKIVSLKQIIETLKKERYINNDTDNIS